MAFFMTIIFCYVSTKEMPSVFICTLSDYNSSSHGNGIVQFDLHHFEMLYLDVSL